MSARGHPMPVICDPAPRDQQRHDDMLTVNASYGEAIADAGLPVEEDANDLYQGSYDVPRWAVELWMMFGRTNTSNDVFIIGPASTRAQADDDWAAALYATIKLGGKRQARLFAISALPRKTK